MLEASPQENYVPLPQTVPLQNPLDKYRGRMFKPTSKQDIRHMLGNAANVIVYDDLKHYRSLDDLLKPYQACVVLYPNPNEAEIGHWICLFVVPGSDILQYFDSYGCYLDSKIVEFNQEDEGVAVHERQPIEPLIIDLILKSDYADTTHWNEYPMQSRKIPTATCGLWCVLRIKNNFLNENEFEKLMYQMPVNMGILPDLAVSAYICKMYPEMA